MNTEGAGAADYEVTVTGRIRATIHVEFQTPAYVISVAAELAGMHPQTLRQYDRLGLVTPGRTGGGGRRYSAHDVEQLREIQRLSQEEGMNLAGVRRVLDLENQVSALRARVAELESEVGRSHAALAAAEAEFASGLYRRTYLPVPVTDRR
jgi:MerR family transcriptional regulator/heat shock protein HspR